MKNLYRNLLSTCAVSVLITGFAAQHAYAQSTPTDDGEFLGTIELGESKRDVLTDTATAETIVEQDEINDRQASTIAELMDSVPGVTLINGSTPTGSGINIRGFGANGTYGTDQKVAIFVDGATTGAEELYRIGNQLFTDPYLYKSVSVIRGTVGSFEYGSGIVGGIVRMETKDASDFTGGEPGFKLGVTAGGATNGNALSTSLIGAWQPTENLEFLGNYAYREQENQNDGNGNEIGNGAFALPSFLLKGLYTFGAELDQSLSASFTQSSSSDRDVPYDTFQTSGGFFGNVDRDTTTQAASLKYNYNPESELINLNVALTYSDQDIQQEAVNPPGFSVLNADHKYETTKLTIKNNGYIEQGSLTHDLRYGIELIRKERADASAAPGGTDGRFAAFIVDDIEFGEKLTISPGLRHESSKLEGELDDGSEYGGSTRATMGGVSARYEIADGLAAFASYAYTESLPILDDLQSESKRILSEKADTIEFGASYNKTGLFTGAGSLSLKANYYKTDLTDVTSYSRVSEVEIQGLELEGSLAFENGIYLDVNANFVDGEELRTTSQTVDWRNVPADNVRATLGKRFGAAFDVSAELVVDSSDVRSVISRSGVIESKKTDGYELLNLRGTYAPQSGPLEGTSIRIGLENVLDKNYRPLLATRNAPGRNVKLTVSRIFF